VSERLDQFMARANDAYYATQDPFADFTTAPEISQVFGEVLGLWAAVVWEQMGQPAPIILAETGPGRGTLMADARRAFQRVAPNFAAAHRLHLIETSPRLRSLQAKVLPDATWHKHIESLPPGPLVLLANEFLDALPIRQFVRRGDGWAERFVEQGEFVEQPAPDLPCTGLACTESEGSIVELRPAATALATTLAARFAIDNGAALFLDYGATRVTTRDGTLQALRGGKPTDPLAEPGQADLTAHVDFDAFSEAARAAGASVHGPVPQGVFLARLGLFQRTDRLARGRSPAEVLALVQAAHRLAEPDHMGRLFQAMALTSPQLPAPPGFELGLKP
jgi:NADH dehydrogenase [ubiquinone] 1 alpha subcomplex assembly factor 7